MHVPQMILSALAAVLLLYIVFSYRARGRRGR